MSRRARSSQPVTLETADIQGGILHGYRLEHAVHLRCSATSGSAGRALLAALLERGVTSDVRREAEPTSTLNVAVSHAGLETLGVARSILDQFPMAFRQGPRARAEALGDVGPSNPTRWEGGLSSDRVHVVVTASASDAEQLDDRVDSLRRLLRDAGVEEVGPPQRTRTLENMAEHFGFSDGAAQPHVEGVRPASDGGGSGGGIPLPGSGWRPVRAGEFVLGYPDEAGEVAAQPTGLLTRNGSYAVHRKLRQHVFRFRQSLDRAAAESQLAREHVAAKIVGRWRDGVPLELEPRRSTTSDLSGEQAPGRMNDFRYLPHDREGFGCPQGAHIRRVNPRDALERGLAAGADTGRLVARHRIIRRGMPYGPGLAPDAREDDGVDRGLMFVCYQADIERQFETIQRAWCIDGDAFELGTDQDFLLGNGQGSGKLTIPVRGAPPRFVTAPANLVTTADAAYLFVPGLAALRRLADHRLG